MQGSPTWGTFAARVTNAGWRTGMAKKIKGVKVFSASMHKEREFLDKRITAWLGRMGLDHQAFEVVDAVVTQSSDESHHCYSMTLFYAL